MAGWMTAPTLAKEVSNVLAAAVNCGYHSPSAATTSGVRLAGRAATGTACLMRAMYDSAGPVERAVIRLVAASATNTPGAQADAARARLNSRAPKVRPGLSTTSCF